MKSADFEAMRRAMVDSQLRTSGVTEPWVLAAMGSVAREAFVPASIASTAYMDRSIPLDSGEVLNPPVASALMLQAANIGFDDRILLIGAPDGYVAALIAQKATDIVAARTLAALPENARAGGYTLILIDGAAETLPEELVALGADGARIVTGLVDGNVTRLAIGYVHGGKVALRSFADSEIAPLPEFARKAEFVF